MKTNTLLLFVASCSLLLPSCTWFSHEETTKTATSSSSTLLSITNDADFKTDVIESKKPTVVKFTAAWCGACKTIQPLYQEIAHEYKDQYAFAVLDVDHARSIAKEYNIQGIPAFLFFKDGKEIDSTLRIIGTVNKAEFITKMTQAFNQVTQ